MTTTKGSSATAGAADETAKDRTATGGPAKVAEQTGTEQDTLRAELDELRAQLAAMQVPAVAELEPAEPEEPTHVLTLACGDSVQVPNPHSTHHYCPDHDVTVPVTGVYALAS